jgi:hypothetical protein
MFSCARFAEAKDLLNSSKEAATMRQAAALNSRIEGAIPIGAVFLQALMGASNA